MTRDHGHDRNFSPSQIERLRQLWDEGKASGPGEPWDLEKFLKEVHEEYDQAKPAGAPTSQSASSEN